MVDEPDQSEGWDVHLSVSDVSLMNEATRVLNSESHFEWVVVLAQAACEVYVREQAVASLPGTNLANAQVLRTFREFTGYAPPPEAEWWRA